MTEEEQAELLVNIEAQGFAGLVHYTKLVSYDIAAVGVCSLSACDCSLRQSVVKLCPLELRPSSSS